MGPLGGVQGLVFGAAPRVENPFPADPLPCVRLGLLPTAMNLGRERRDTGGKQGTCGSLEFLWLEPGGALPPASYSLRPPPVYLQLP